MFIFRNISKSNSMKKNCLEFELMPKSKKDVIKVFPGVSLF